MPQGVSNLSLVTIEALWDGWCHHCNGEQAKESVPWASYACTWFVGRLGQLFYFQAHGNFLSFWSIFQAFVFYSILVGYSIVNHFPQFRTSDETNFCLLLTMHAALDLAPFPVLIFFLTFAVIKRKSWYVYFIFTVRSAIWLKENISKYKTLS